MRCPTMAIDTPRDDTENAFLTRRGGGAAERAGLENRYGLRAIVGSNPTLSASIFRTQGGRLQTRCRNTESP